MSEIAQLKKKVRGGGAPMMDKVRPKWYLEVDEAKLDMDDLKKDVLGQLFGTYADGLIVLQLDEEGSRVNGFSLPPGGEERDETGRQLTEAWRAEIKKRKKKK